MKDPSRVRLLDLRVCRRLSVERLLAITLAEAPMRRRESNSNNTMEPLGMDK